MADVVGQGVITIDGDTKPFEAQMAVASAAANRAAGQAAVSWQAQLSKISSASAAMASAVGGRFGEVANLANSALRPLVEVGAAFGPIGAGAAAAATAMTGFAVASVKVTDAALEARKRLAEFEGELRGPELGNYERATTGLRIAADELTVTLGERLAPALTGIVDWLELGFKSATKLIGGFENVGTAAENMEGKLENVIGSLKFSGDAPDLETVFSGLVPTYVSPEDQAAAIEQTARVMEARLAYYRAVADLAASTAAAEQESDAATRDAMIASNEAVLASERELAAEVDELRIAGELAAEADAKAEEARIRGIIALTATYTEEALGSISTILDLQLASWETMRDAGTELTREQAQAANNALDAATAVAVAQAGVSAALTTIGSLASMSALLIPPWISVPASVALGATAFAATVAGIHARQPARFSWSMDAESAAGAAEAALFYDADDDGTPNNVEAKGGEVTSSPDTARRAGGPTGSSGRTTANGVQVEVIVRSGLPGRSGRGSN